MIRIRMGQKMKGSAVVILNDAGSILLLKRAQICYWMPGKWGLPGGKIEKGETSEQAAIREVYEETELSVKDLVHIKKHSNPQVDIFYAPVYTGTVKIDFEHDDYRWVSRSDVDKMDTIPDLVKKFDWVIQNG